jgi:predicted glutamine amidotransferase
MCRIFLLWKSDNITHKEIRHMVRHSKHRDEKTDEYETETATDGYGFAGYSKQTHRWNLYKTVNTYETDPDFSRVLDTFSNYSFIIGHMRKRPKWSPVRVENNHPFYYKNNVFLQYGNINGLETQHQRTKVIRTLLPEFIPNIQGTTDSELLFYLFLTNYRKAVLPATCPHALQEIYTTNAIHYKPLCLLYVSIVKTLEYVHQHFPKITTNIIYSNKQYTMVLRHYHVNPPHKLTTPNTLYWNNPVLNDKNRITITTRPTFLSKTRIPDDTLLFIENATGKTFVLSYENT